MHACGVVAAGGTADKYCHWKKKIINKIATESLKQFN
jgi:hypothetical protein